MVLCAVRGCKMRTDTNYQDGIGFYALPTVRKNAPLHSQRSCERRRSLWLAKLGKADSGKPLKVCSRHFISGECPLWHREREREEKKERQACTLLKAHTLEVRANTSMFSVYVSVN